MMVKIKWLIRLTPGSKITVKVGDKVDVGQLLGKTSEKNRDLIDMSSLVANLDNHQKEQLISQSLNQEVVAGQIIFQSGLINKTIIKSPVDGRVVGWDEFGNMEVESVSGKTKEYISPVEAKVGLVDKEKITLSFSGEEFKGQTIVTGKTWANGVEKIEKINDLNYKMEGKIVALTDFNRSWLYKAEAIGAVGVIFTNIIDSNLEQKIDLAIPVIMMTDVEAKKMFKISGLSNKRILLNAGSGRVIITR
ncbi:MAG TPA: hypothetical protein PK370_02310 [Candidatus Woesebacteria bacterium]|nr:hypothetical protein [Candidatus Woesebacteria bacterium]HPJ17191.1 hypothetical protein [Candidatus Woesebacteria bacterium]